MIIYKANVNKIKNIIKTLNLIWKSSQFNFIAMVVLTILNGIILPINTVISKFLIDSVIIEINVKNKIWYENKVFFWLSAEFIVVMLSYIINRLNSYFCNIQTKCVSNYISKMLIEKALELDFSYYENSKFYNKIEKANSQSAYSAMSTINSLTQIIKNLSTLAGSMIIIIKLNTFLLILCMMTSVPMFIINMKISKIKYDIYNNRIEKNRFATYLQKTIIDYNSVKEIKLNRIGYYFKNIILSIFKDNLEQDKTVGKKQAISLSIVDFFSSIISYIYKGYVIYITLLKKLSIGTMNMYISSLTNTEDAIRNMLESFISLYSSNFYIEDLFYVLNLKPIMIDDKRSRKFNNKVNKNIEFRNVSFKYPNSDVYVLKNVSFTIDSNKTCAIVGLNGSGKTTIIKLLARLYDPTEGDIYIDAINIKEYKTESLYKCMSVVFQDFMKYQFTVKDNIGFGDIDNIDDIKLIKIASKKSKADDFIEGLKLKYDTKLGKIWDEGMELSLGQWQKLAISRAFMSESAILILDEPTASVDAQTEYDLFKNFKQLTQSRTSILISHRFSTVKIADKIIVLKDGCIIEEGSHDELIDKNGFYSSLYTMQANGYITNELSNKEFI
jgi:ATP-binding cassette subfamily B protein/ATP-binding cassette subfamily C protein